MKNKISNIVFSGCRNFNDYKFIKSTLDSIIKNKNKKQKGENENDRNLF